MEMLPWIPLLYNMIPEAFPATWGEAFFDEPVRMTSMHRDSRKYRLKRCRDWSRLGFTLGVLMIAATLIGTALGRKRLPLGCCVGLVATLLLENVAHNLLLLVENDAYDMSELHQMIVAITFVMSSMVSFIGWVRAAPVRTVSEATVTVSEATVTRFVEEFSEFLTLVKRSERMTGQPPLLLMDQSAESVER